MSSTGLAHADAQRPERSGILTIVTRAVYRMLVLEVMLVVAVLPSVVAIALLDRDASNIPVFVVALLPVVPAFVAGVGVVVAARRDPDVSPTPTFFRAYRTGFLPTVRWAVPGILLMAVLVFNLAHVGALVGAPVLRPALLFAIALLVVWSGYMVVLTAGFTFRTRDAARVAASLVFRHAKFSTGMVCLAFLAIVSSMAFAGVGAVLLGWAFVALTARLSHPVVADITERFTVHE